MKQKLKDNWISEVIIRGHGSLITRISSKNEYLYYFRYYDQNKTRCITPIQILPSSFQKERKNAYQQARTKAHQLATLHQSGVTDIRQFLALEKAATIAQKEAEHAQLKAQIAIQKLEALHCTHAKTVQNLFEHWMHVEMIYRKDKGAEVRRIFEKDVLPALGHLPTNQIRKNHIMQIADALVLRGADQLAQQVFSLMRQMFRFAIERDLTSKDPTTTLQKKRIGCKAAERHRVLSDDEIRFLFHQIFYAKLIPTTEAAIWITLSTCCRIGELLKAKWTEINWSKRIWTIPADHAKNGRSHQIHLSDFALMYFKRIHAIHGHSPWCFPNRNGSDCVTQKTVTKQITDRQRSTEQGKMRGRSNQISTLILTGGKWTPHDLRRTGATIMASLGVLPEVIERCLNHIETNRMKRIYQQYKYSHEMKEAWHILGQHLSTLTQNNIDLN